MSSYRDYYLSIVEGKKKEIDANIIRFILLPLSFIYSFFPFLKEKLYQTGILKSIKLDVPVISVGNLSWGGTGKTPAVIEISNILKKHSINHSIISRGYGSNSQKNRALIVSDRNKILEKPPLASDENYLLASKLSGIPIIQDRDRIRAGTLAVKEFETKAIILDDAYQHLKADRDVNILLWDSRVTPQKAYPIPAGTLRERISAVKRADAIILTKTNQKGSQYELCRNFFEKLCPDKRIFTASHKAVEIKENDNDDSEIQYDMESIKGKKTVGFCAIADCDSFKSTLEELGVEICQFFPFRDHHFFSEKDISILSNAFQKNKADFLITTEKDVSRCGSLLKKAGRVLYPVISFKINEEEEFEKFIISKISPLIS